MACVCSTWRRSTRVAWLVLTLASCAAQARVWRRGQMDDELQRMRNQLDNLHEQFRAQNKAKQHGSPHARKGMVSSLAGFQHPPTECTVQCSIHVHYSWCSPAGPVLLACGWIRHVPCNLCHTTPGIHMHCNTAAAECAVITSSRLSTCQRPRT